LSNRKRKKIVKEQENDNDGGFAGKEKREEGLGGSKHPCYTFLFNKI